MEALAETYFKLIGGLCQLTQSRDGLQVAAERATGK